MCSAGSPKPWSKVAAGSPKLQSDVAAGIPKPSEDVAAESLKPMSVEAAESLKPASSRSCDDDVHTLDVFGGVNGGEESEANRFGKEKAGKMAVFGNGSIKCVNEYKWYDMIAMTLGKSWGNASKGECWNLNFVLAIPTGLKGVPT